METKTRRALRGRFVARDLGAGAWQLSTYASGGPEIYLAGAEPNAAQILRGASFAAVTLEWPDGVRQETAPRDGAVLLTLTSTAGAQVLSARNAIIHEPLTHLYDRLPLASFDPTARRFWRRVFRLIRIPGGRHLMGMMARRVRTQRS